MRSIMVLQRNVWLSAFVFILILLSSSAFAQQTEASTDQAELEVEQSVSEKQQEYLQWALELWNSMEPQQGEIDLPGEIAKLDVPDDFYYLNSEDSRKVLVDAWGNPESSAQGILGMLFPAQSNPFDNDSWGVTIEYEQDGYVEDDDAADIDYDDMLSSMQDDTRESSKQRVEMGYEPIELVGWAAQPYYDAQSKKLYWAKEIRFGDADLNTLNYNIRVLGRKGILVLNFIAGMDQLDIINQNLVSVLDIAEFKDGSRYADFNPEMDEVAAYGIGALVAGKVIAKTGFLAAALIFLFKFGIIILIGIGVFVKKAFSKRKAKSQD